MTSTLELTRFRERACEIAIEAGGVLLEHFGSELKIETKANDIDLVTAADRAAEAIIVDRLNDAFPDHTIVAEESGSRKSGRELVWYVDPLDGTTNFAHGVPHFAVVLALYRGETGLVGVVYDPVRDELFSAAKGLGATLRSPLLGEFALNVSSLAPLRQCLLATGFGYERQTNLGLLGRILPKVRGIRRAGCAALDMAYVASGRLDAYWELDLQPWDWGAGAVLVAEAGGIAVTRDGRPWLPGDLTLAAGRREVVRALRTELGWAKSPTG